MPGKAVQPTALPSNAPHRLPPLSPSLHFLPVCSLQVRFSLDHFHQGLADLVHQPEHSSSTILRADILDDQDPPDLDSSAVLPLDGFSCVRRVRRRILPSRPQFDHAMEQECLFYERRTDEAGADDEAEGLVLLLPDFEQLKQEHPAGKLPYYHPQVHALAFRYLPASLSSASPPSASLRLDLIPLPSPSSPSSSSSTPLALLAPTDRLFRTSLALVKFVAKICGGKQDGFQKRVHHDLLAGKEDVQDLYQVLKEKYKTNLSASSPHAPRITFRWLLTAWREGTDPEKHVFEDVAIVAWLICLWRRMYPDNEGKPPGGFVDVGCGNGLLVYLLNAEGFSGYGFDLRARKSWAHYDPQPDLRVQSLNPVDLLLPSPFLSSSPSSASPASPEQAWPFPTDAFLIGNHADEMTPWLALLAAATPGDRVGFLNIPCCLHELVGRFERMSYTIPEEYLSSLPSPPSPPPASSPPAAAAESATPHPLLVPFYAPSPSILSDPLLSSGKPAGGRYHAYQLYLAHLALRCGFVPEREALRIPSTKNFGMVGRRRVWEGLRGEEREQARERAREEVRALVEEVRRKGEWRARKPEGKAGEH
ncbi:hypothetical protein JCM8097_005069 [Rhodosporidiobolus ruineniae]